MGTNISAVTRASFGERMEMSNFQSMRDADATRRGKYARILSRAVIIFKLIRPHVIGAIVIFLTSIYLAACLFIEK